MTKLAEYRDIRDAPCATRTVFEEKFSSKVRAKVSLSWVSEGWEPAGSVARWTDGYYSVRWMDHTGAYQGRRFLPTGDGAVNARNHFDRLTA